MIDDAPAQDDPIHADSCETPPDATEAIVEPDDALPPMAMEALPDVLKQAAAQAQWEKLMPVQTHAIPYLLAGRELMVQSRTGSGKTGAFILPMLDRLDPAKNECQALVLVPTRELALQVAKEASLLCGKSGIRTVAVYGGVGYGPQIDGFKKGAHLVVGTPGRILDHLYRRTLSLDGLGILVFDEADRMLSMGFYPDMREVKRFLPRRGLTSYMFSATFPPRVMQLSGEFLRKPDFLNLSSDCVHVSEVAHVFYRVPPMDKDRGLIRIIELENPASALIFCNKKSRVHYVNVVLQRFGYDADELTSDLAQGAREKVLTRVRQGRLRFLVATDVAARGIDLPELSHVFQYEPPEDPEAYIHRAGRTGRAGASGTAISLVSNFEEIEIQQIAKRFQIGLQEREMPTDADVADIVSQRVTALLEARLRSRDKIQVERMQRFVGLAQSLGQNEDEVMLLAMLLDDFHQETEKAASAASQETADDAGRKASDRESPSHSDNKRRKSRGGRRRSGQRRRRR